MIDHVTYEVPKGALHPGKTGELADFFGALELDEVPPDPVIEKGWNVRWWTDGDGKFQIHLVEGEKEGWSGWRLGLAHFCVIVSLTGYELLREIGRAHV